MTHELEIKPLQGNVTSEELMQLAQLMFGESRFQPLGLDRDKLFAHVVDILSGDSWIAFGAFDNGVFCGMAIGSCGEELPFTSSVVATEYYLFLTPPYRGAKEAKKLLSAFLREAKLRKAKDVVFSNAYGGDPEKAGRLFQSCGLTLLGGVYSLGD